MVQRQTLLTAEEFFRRYSHRDGRYELVRGEVIEMAPPGSFHGRVALGIGAAILSFLQQHDLGEAMVESGYRMERQPDTVRGPDVSFIRKERLPEGGLPHTFFEGAPDLAVEVVSPSNTAAGMETKVHEYLENGVQRVWVVYPDGRRVAVHRPDGSAQCYEDGEVLTDNELLPGFSLPVTDIFPR